MTRFPPLPQPIRVALSSGLVILVVSCGGGGSDSTAPGGNTNTGGTNNGGSTITMPGTQFEPSGVTIHAGGTVTWVFSGVTHNVVFTGGAGKPLDLGSQSNVTLTRTFNTAGVFTMTCTIHAGMTGTVTVQ